MLGAIVGDVVGSRFEFNNHRSKDFELFVNSCEATDDSIMTIAIGKALVETDKEFEVIDEEYLELLKENSVKYMQEIGRKYPHCGFGGRFYGWIFSNEFPKPYNSYGNGSAMRVSPVVYFSKTIDDVKKLSKAVTEVSHNHPEGIKGAEATAVAIFMAKSGRTIDEIRKEIEDNYYDLDFTIDGIRDTYRFNETCQDTVPQAIQAFLESNSFEDAIRIAISVGGDSDTLAAITGSIAGEYYEIPGKIENETLKYLDDYLLDFYDEFNEYIKDNKWRIIQIIKERSLYFLNLKS